MKRQSHDPDPRGSPCHIQGNASRATVKDETTAGAKGKGQTGSG